MSRQVTRLYVSCSKSCEDSCAGAMPFMEREGTFVPTMGRLFCASNEDPTRQGRLPAQLPSRATRVHGPSQEKSGVACANPTASQLALSLRPSPR